MPLRLVGHPAPDFKLVGTRSCAIRHRTSEKREHLVKLMGKSLSSDSARACSEKQEKEAPRRAAPDARERIPIGGAARSYHFYGATNDSILTRNKGLLVSPFLELFLDRSGPTYPQKVDKFIGRLSFIHAGTDLLRKFDYKSQTA